MEQLTLGEIDIEVEFKDIKNIHLSVHPPNGRVRIAAPTRMELDTIRVYAISKLVWIRKQRSKIIGQEREPPRDFLNKESHYYKGKRYLMKIVEVDVPPKVVLKHSTMLLYVRPNASKEKMKAILYEWYRLQLKNILPEIIEKWEDKLNVKVEEFGIKKMRTKWGTCNRDAKRIWLNLELAKKPLEHLEYVVVHEMVHLLERRHNERFSAYMDKFLPKWRFYKEELNRLPVKNESWDY